MKYMKKFGVFQINEAKYQLSDDLRNLIAEIDSPISNQILSADGDEVGELGMLDIDAKTGEVVVKKGPHKSPIKMGRAVNALLGSGNYDQNELENFSKMVYRKISTDVSVSVPDEYVEDFPDNFSGALIRGVKMNKQELFVDEPGKRKVSVGDSNDENYLKFIQVLSKNLSERVDKSVHMLLSRGSGDMNSLSRFGNIYRCVPEKGATFSYCTYHKNGGVGNLWFFAAQILRENMKHIDLLTAHLDTSSTEETIDVISNMAYEKDKWQLENILEGYVNWLYDIEIIGDMTYDELVEKCKTETRTIHVWTESDVLHVLV
jgi:hypothetical protein